MVFFHFPVVYSCFIQRRWRADNKVNNSKTGGKFIPNNDKRRSFVLNYYTNYFVAVLRNDMFETLHWKKVSPSPSLTELEPCTPCTVAGGG